MKKLLLVLGVGALMSFSLNSCNKCGTCSTQDNLIYQGEYCKGNAIEDALYNAAETECELANGSFDK
jgi:hypothetical protein